MKITLTESIEKKVTKEIPQYFKNDRNGFFAISNDELTYLKVYDCSHSPELGLFPYVRSYSTVTIDIEVKPSITPISETEFKSAFLRVSNQLENLLK